MNEFKLIAMEPTVEYLDIVNTLYKTVNKAVVVVVNREAFDKYGISVFTQDAIEMIKSQYDNPKVKSIEFKYKGTVKTETDYYHLAAQNRVALIFTFEY